ncbi:MAG: hypothetical protein E6Q34_06245 [Burkholderiaceae bacterium]|nr:MAG: hypothetical protein E6Q34_06245 [Burkholderiaceae bacterium]
MSSAVLTIATDVYGETPASAALCRYLGISANIISPYPEPSQFRNEKDAYTRFLAEGGVAHYAKKIAEVLEQKRPQFFIGFGVGGSAWWMEAAQLQLGLDSATLFYPSRVRDHLDLHSTCPTRFIFAQEETAYDSRAVVEQLRLRGHQAEIAKDTRHGFMNSFAAGFSLKRQTEYLDQLVQTFHGRLAA